MFTTYRYMLRKIRITLASITFILLTLLFLDFTGITHGWFGWLARIQFIPALLALNVGIVVALIVLTLLFGRIYCSVICPLGIFQDVISWGGSRQKKNRFRYSPARKWLRYSLLAVFVFALIASFFASFHMLFGLLEPYSAYGRIASNLFAPFYRWGNNILAYLAERADSYAFYSTEVWIRSISTFIISLLTFLIVGYLAWRNGRTYCNTICPVGTLLGFLSEYSLFKPVFDQEKCNKCGLCARNCKAACIDAKNQQIDYSRCVSCMNCLEKCNKEAMIYSRRRAKVKEERTQEDDSRRRFLSVTSVMALTTVAARAQQLHVDGGFADIEDKKAPDRQTHIIPPGGVGITHFARHCTACQLCVSVCPNQILCPSAAIGRMMQPEISYERGYCRPECTKCSEVCPTGAIRKITTADKSATQIGRAVWKKELCLPYSGDVKCNNCARHCPVDAIQMIPNKNSESGKELPVPAVDTERCTGCGGCENLCPSRPYSAIYVEGNVKHHEI